MATSDADRTLDVREIDEPPFAPIMTELDRLPPDTTLCLINSFEPTPLYSVLEQRGFEYESRQQAEDEWHIHIRHE